MFFCTILRFSGKLLNSLSSFDYLQMLRTMKGYDEYNTILLPPRQPGDKLPQEVVDAYNEQQRKKEAEEKEKAEAAASAAAAQAEKSAEEGGESGAPPVIATVPASASGERDGGKAGSDVGEGAKDGKGVGRIRNDHTEYCYL